MLLWKDNIFVCIKRLNIVYIYIDMKNCICIEIYGMINNGSYFILGLLFLNELIKILVSLV